MSEPINNEEQGNSYNNYLLYASCVVTGVIAHTIGYAVEIAANYSLRKHLPNCEHTWAFAFAGKVLHEGVENIISSGGFINLMNLNNLKDSILKSFEPVYEEPGKFVSAAAFSYTAETALSIFMHHGHNHRGHDHGHGGCSHSPLEIVLAAGASVVGATLGIYIYDYFAGE